MVSPLKGKKKMKSKPFPLYVFNLPQIAPKINNCKFAKSGKLWITLLLRKSYFSCRFFYFLGTFHLLSKQQDSNSQSVEKLKVLCLDIRSIRCQWRPAFATVDTTFSGNGIEVTVLFRIHVLCDTCHEDQKYIV